MIVKLVEFVGIGLLKEMSVTTALKKLFVRMMMKHNAALKVFPIWINLNLRLVLKFTLLLVPLL